MCSCQPLSPCRPYNRLYSNILIYLVIVTNMFMPPVSIDSESIRSFTKNIHHSNAIRLMEKSILSAIFYMNAMKPTCKWVLNVVKTNERSAFVHHVIFTFILTYFSMNFSTRLKLRHLQSGHHKLWVTCLILHQSLSILFVYCFVVLCTKAKMIFQANGIDCAHDVYVNFFFSFLSFPHMIPVFGHFSDDKLCYFDTNIKP